MIQILGLLGMYFFTFIQISSGHTLGSHTKLRRQNLNLPFISPVPGTTMTTPTSLTRVVFITVGFKLRTCKIHNETKLRFRFENCAEILYIFFIFFSGVYTQERVIMERIWYINSLKIFDFGGEFPNKIMIYIAQNPE